MRRNGNEHINTPDPTTCVAQYKWDINIVYKRIKHLIPLNNDREKRNEKGDKNVAARHDQT